MSTFAIIETEAGLSVVAVPADSTAERVAAERGAYLIDPGPYDSYDEACDALLAIPDDEEELSRE